jgi:hypothetical protein
MPRRELLTSAQREELLAFPTEEVDLIRHYTFSAHDVALIRRRLIPFEEVARTLALTKGNVSDFRRWLNASNTELDYRHLCR